jgi:formyltetrahydrofolate synthetase
LENKIRIIASKMYGAVGVNFPPKVVEKIKKYEEKVQ